MVTAQTQTHGSIQQNRKCRSKPTTVESINLQQRMKEHPMGKRRSLRNTWCCENWTRRRRMKLDHFCLHTHTHTPRWIKDLNETQDATKILEHRSNLFYFGQNNCFLGRSPDIRRQNKLLGLHPNESFCTEEATKLKGNLDNRKRYLQKAHLIKTSQIYIEFTDH